MKKKRNNTFALQRRINARPNMRTRFIRLVYLLTFISSVVEGLRHLSDDQNIPLQVAIDKKFGQKSAK